MLFKKKKRGDLIDTQPKTVKKNVRKKKEKVMQKKNGKHT